MDFDIKPYYNYILKIYISGLLPQIVKFDSKSNLNLASFVCLLLNKHNILGKFSFKSTNSNN